MLKRERSPGVSVALGSPSAGFVCHQFGSFAISLVRRHQLAGLAHASRRAQMDDLSLDELSDVSLDHVLTSPLRTRLSET